LPGALDNMAITGCAGARNADARANRRAPVRFAMTLRYPHLSQRVRERRFASPSGRVAHARDEPPA